MSVTPERILQLGLGFWASKTMLSAVELDVFTTLDRGPLDAHALASRLGLHQRSALDFLDALVAMHVLEREGGQYRNTPDAAEFLVRGKPAYVGGFLEMSNARLYRFWGDLTEALQTGKPQNEVKHSGEAMFQELYSDPARLEQIFRHV